MIRLAAPAKLNLHLRVLGMRSDGFHSIESLFIRLGLRDEVVLDLGPDGIQFEVSGDFHVPGGRENLCVAAAASFYDEIGQAPATTIRLTKRIPVAAGLGGGSSDVVVDTIGVGGTINRTLSVGPNNYIGGPGGGAAVFNANDGVLTADFDVRNVSGNIAQGLTVDADFDDGIDVGSGIINNIPRTAGGL